MVRNRSQSIVEEIASGQIVNTSDPDFISQTEDFPEAHSLKNVSETPEEPPSQNASNEKPSMASQYHYQTYLDPTAIGAIEDEQMDRLLNFVSVCEANKEILEEMNSEANAILNKVADLEAKYNQVTLETADFESELNRLMETQGVEKQRLQQMEDYLKHFSKFDFIAKHLNRSGYFLVIQRSETFRNEILVVLDDALEFLALHPLFKDVDIYTSRFRQCMTRSMTLIKNWLVDEMRNRQDQMVQMAAKAKGTNPEVFVYTEFTNYDYQRFLEWVAEIDNRIPNHQEYRGLLWDVANQYFKSRLKLVGMLAPPADAEGKLIVQATQDIISHFKRVVAKEVALHQKFFVTDTTNDQLYYYLKVVLDPLYDNVRQLTLKENNIGRLCELATLLQKYYEFEDDEDGIKYNELFNSIVEQVQARLMFRIQLYVDHTLMQYHPKPEDLQLARRRSVLELEANVLDGDFADNSFPNIYLPMAKALTLLNTIYGLINNAVFDDVAHYIVHSCIQLLNGGFLKLAASHLGSLDAKLLLLKQVLALREQVLQFDIRIVHNDYLIDFTLGLTDVWQTLRQGQFSLNNAGLIEMVKKLVPRVVNNMTDANYEIEMELNNAINDFIKEALNIISDPIINGRDAADPRAIGLSYKHNLITKIPFVYSQLVSFIEDLQVRKYLMTNLSNLVVVTYDSYYKYLMDHLQDKLVVNDVMETETLRGFVAELVAGQFENE